MRADRTIGICDRDRTFKDGLECLPDIKPLGLAADQHRYRLEFACDLAGRLGRRDARSLCGGGGITRRRSGIEPQLQIHVGDIPLQLQFRDLGDGLRLGVLSLLLCFRRDAGAKFSLGGSQLRLGYALQIFRRANRHPGLRGLPQGRPGG